MFGAYFYHAIVKKYIAVFGTLFNDIQIKRLRDDTSTQTIKVPLMYSSQDKMLARLNEDPQLDRQVAGVSPIISFTISAPKYDPSRKLQSTLQRCIKNTDGSITTQFIGIPYNFDVTLCIYAKEEEDGLQVLEQICPYFTPSMTVNVIMEEEMNYSVDVPIILNPEIQFENQSYGKFQNHRYLIWTLNFTMKGELLGPLSSNPKNVIRRVRVFFNDQTTRASLEELVVQPGLTPNGQPTDSQGLSIPITEIKPDDNYGYVINIVNDPDETSDITNNTDPV